MRALVTGCAGFIGSHVTESLLISGSEVVGIDCFNANYARAEKLQNLEQARSWDAFDFVPIDLARGELEGFVADCDVVFHLAAEPGVRASWGARFDAYLDNNVLATQHLLEAAKSHPPRRFVYASSSSIYGNAEHLPTREDDVPAPFSPYGVTKLAAEHLCHLYRANWGIDTVALRFFSVFGPRQRPDMAFQRFCMAALTGEPLVVFGDGEQSRDFTFVSDVVAATLAAASTPGVSGNVYNVGGGSRVTVNDTLKILSELAGSRLDVTYTEGPRGDVRATGADISRAQEDLGYEPKVGVTAGLTAQFEGARAAHQAETPIQPAGASAPRAS